MQNVIVTSLHVYPVKSCGAIDLTEATIRARGFEFDRTWMVVEPDGTKVTQREVPLMAQIKPRIEGGDLILSHSRCDPLRVPLDGTAGRVLTVNIWGHSCNALDEGDAAARWLSALVEREVRLVKFDPSHVRHVDEAWAGTSGAHTGFSDALPFLITAQESLAALNRYRQEAGLPPSPMSRFRPNIVIQGAGAFGEDSIAALQVPGSSGRLELVRPCSRCIMTDIDQNSGEREVSGNFAILKRTRKLRNIKGELGPMFGVQALSTNAEGHVLKLGDSLALLEHAKGLPALPRFRD